MSGSLEIREVKDDGVVSYVVDYVREDMMTVRSYFSYEESMCRDLRKMKFSSGRVRVASSLEGGIRGISDAILNSRGDVVFDYQSR